MDKLTLVKSFDEFEPILHNQNDTTYVINFWATWCGPCVKELPYFEALHQDYKDEKFKMILVSLDFEKQLESKLIPFLNDHDIQSEVLVLLAGKAHKWIDRVDPQWSGAIPITIIRSGADYKFYEKVFHSKAELDQIVSPFLKP